MGDDEDDIETDSLLRAVAEAPARAPPDPALQSGRRIGGFRIISKLGAGGMGVVYRAEDERLRREVALKVIAPSSEPDAAARRRFLREARSAAAVNHPNVATVFEVGEDEGRIFIAMELVDGVTLRTMVADGKLGIDQAIGIARQIARGLAKAHERGIVHRDLKPDNIIVGESVKVLDFGLARMNNDTSLEAASTATAQNEIAGTPGYMSPEQTIGGAVDVRSDVFAFGVVLYEMLVGKRPFLGNSGMAVAIAIARDPHTPLSEQREDVPPEVEHIVDRCLQKSPDKRYASAKEILEALEAFFVTPMPSSARRPSGVVDKPSARSRLRPIGAIVVVSALAIGAWRWSLPSMHSPRADTAATDTSTTAPSAPPSPPPMEISSSPATAASSATMTPPRPAVTVVPRPLVPPAHPAVSASSPRPKRDPLGDQH